MKTFTQLALEVARMSGDISEPGLVYSAEEVTRAVRAIGYYRNHVWSFFKTVAATITMTAEKEGTYDLPAALRRLTSLYWTMSDGTIMRLTPATETQWYDETDHVTYGDPTRYRIVSGKLYIAPAPSVSHISLNGSSLYLEYEAKPVDAAVAGPPAINAPNFPDDFEDAIVHWAAAKRCVRLEDYQKGSTLLSVAQGEIDLLLANDALQHNGLPVMPVVLNPWGGGTGEVARNYGG